ncbi:SDR family NAD(P)-dependent oxidoreductase [Rubripirellula obstinata]|nr:SDR family oxidoreductase [Rubripirellula obstinata]
MNDVNKVAVVTGGSAGLGFLIAQALLRQDYFVVIVGRSEERLREAARQLEAGSVKGVAFQVADVTVSSDAKLVFDEVLKNQGRLDVLVNCVGQSDRGQIATLTVDRLNELINQNVVSAMLCCQSAIELLEKSGGVIVNIGSLAAKVSPRFLGGYAIAKHALAAMTGQMRLELRPKGIHVGLVNPGPIRRSDAGSRYDNQLDASLPDQAKKPGAGARISGLDPQRVVNQVLRMIRKRKPDILIPGYLRYLIAAGQATPRFGDWLLMKFTSGK